MEGDLANALEDQIALAEDKDTAENEHHAAALAEVEQRAATAVPQWEEAKTTIITLQGVVEGLEQELATLTALSQQVSHILMMRSINKPFQCTLPIHPINTPLHRIITM